MRRTNIAIAAVLLTLAAGWSAAQRPQNPVGTAVPMPKYSISVGIASPDECCANPTTGAWEAHLVGFPCPVGYQLINEPCPVGTPVPVPTIAPDPTAAPGPDPVQQYGGWLVILLQALGDKITWSLPLTLLGTLGSILAVVGLLRRALASFGGIILPAKAIQIISLVLGAVGTAITDATQHGAVTGTVLASLIEGLVAAYLAMKTWDATASTEAKKAIGK